MAPSQVSARSQRFIEMFNEASAEHRRRKQQSVGTKDVSSDAGDIFSLLTPIIEPTLKPMLELLPPLKAVLRAFVEQRDIMNDELVRLFWEDVTYPLLAVAMLPRNRPKAAIQWGDRKTKLRECPKEKGAMLLYARHVDAKTGNTRDVELKFRLNGFLSPDAIGAFFAATLRFLSDGHPSEHVRDALRKRMPKAVRFFEKFLKFHDLTLYQEEREKAESERRKLFYRPKSSKNKGKRPTDCRHICIRIPFDMKSMKRNYGEVAAVLGLLNFLKLKVMDATERKRAGKLFFHHNTLELHAIVHGDRLVWYTDKGEPIQINGEYHYVDFGEKGIFHLLADFKLRLVQYRMPLVRFELRYDTVKHDLGTNLKVELAVLELKAAALDGIAEIGGLPIKKIKALLEDTFKLTLSLTNDMLKKNRSSNLGSAMSSSGRRSRGVSTSSSTVLSVQNVASHNSASSRDSSSSSGEDSTTGYSLYSGLSGISNISKHTLMSSHTLFQDGGEGEKDLWLLSVDMDFEFVSKMSGIAKAVSKTVMSKVVHDAFSILHDWVDATIVDYGKMEEELVLMPAAFDKAVDSVKREQERNAQQQRMEKLKAILLSVIGELRTNKKYRLKLALFFGVFVISILIASIVRYAAVGLFFYILFGGLSFWAMTVVQSKVEEGELDLKALLLPLEGAPEEDERKNKLSSISEEEQDKEIHDDQEEDELMDDDELEDSEVEEEEPEDEVPPRSGDLGEKKPSYHFGLDPPRLKEVSEAAEIPNPLALSPEVLADLLSLAQEPEEARPPPLSSSLERKVSLARESSDGFERECLSSEYLASKAEPRSCAMEEREMRSEGHLEYFSHKFEAQKEEEIHLGAEGLYGTPPGPPPRIRSAPLPMIRHDDLWTSLPSQ